MLATRRDPFRDLATMERTVDRIFGGLFGTPVTNRSDDEPGFFRLPINIEQVEDKYVITAPLAGFKPEEVEVNFADGVLTISAKHGEETRTNGDGYIRREMVLGNLYRQIPVGQIDPSTVSAQFENGVLKVSVPAPAKPEPVKIAIKRGSGSKELKSGSRR